MKKILSFAVFTLLYMAASAQAFTFKCIYEKTSLTPQCYIVPYDNVFNMFFPIPYIKDSDNSFHFTLMPSSVSFFKIGGDAVMVSPGDHATGYFDARHAKFEPGDSNSINFTLAKISKGMTQLIARYGIGSDFEKFKSVVHLLNEYMDSTNATLDQKSKPWLNASVIFALKEYEFTRLAHFLVLPVLFKNNYDKNELVQMVHKNIRIRSVQYWLQLEPGRIFLHTYYRKICLPDANFNAEKSFEDKLFASHLIRKLLTYDYFTECMERGNVKSKIQLVHDWQQYHSKLELSKDEDAEMQLLYTKIKHIGEDISDVFCTLPMMDREGKMLTMAQKQKLIAGKNVILDFWASWCVPCREKMTRLNSDHVTLNHQQYHIIYLSIDDNTANWKGAHFAFLDKTNSFRITDGNNEFIKRFAIRYIPRYMLLNESALISSEFSFE
jgi:thiol-disulfide isomerase/thioredoxin